MRKFIKIENCEVNNNEKKMILEFIMADVVFSNSNNDKLKKFADFNNLNFDAMVKDFTLTDDEIIDIYKNLKNSSFSKTLIHFDTEILTIINFLEIDEIPLIIDENNQPTQNFSFNNKIFQIIDNEKIIDITDCDLLFD